MITELNGAPVNAAQLAAQDHAWAEIQRKERAAQQRYERARAASEAIATGRTLAGFREVRTFDGMTWQRGAPQALPPDFPARYRAAVDQTWQAEQAARQHLAEAQQQAQAWINQNGPSDGLARLKWEEATLEPQRAVERAAAAVEEACAAFGATYTNWTAATATIADAPAIKRQIEQEAERRLAEAETRVLVAQAELTRLAG